MTLTGNVEENFKTLFQKFELCHQKKKPTKLNLIKCALFLHVAREKAIEVYLSLPPTRQDLTQGQKPEG